MRRFRRYLHSLLAFTLLVAGPASAGTPIYKYQDETGRWRFSDAPPQEKSSERIEYRHKSNLSPKFRVEERQQSSGHRLVAINPYHGPVEVQIRHDDNGSIMAHRLVPPDSETVIHEDREPIDDYKAGWVLGDPGAEPGPQHYRPPFRSNMSRPITQGFLGRYSHTGLGNRYAVDIALPVGSPIVAARAGQVMEARDNFHMAGQNRYFVDKANIIKVLHDDGTYAVYAHILQGSARVQAGDRVALGQTLAQSGSTGFSTGPHLHFVIRRNIGMDVRSLPFQFVGEDGQLFQPRSGQRLLGADR